MSLLDRFKSNKMSQIVMISTYVHFFLFIQQLHNYYHIPI